MVSLFKDRLDCGNIRKLIIEKDRETGSYVTFDDLFKFRSLIGYGAYGVVVKVIN